LPRRQSRLAMTGMGERVQDGTTPVGEANSPLKGGTRCALSVTCGDSSPKGRAKGRSEASADNLPCVKGGGICEANDGGDQKQQIRKQPLPCHCKGVYARGNLKQIPYRLPRRFAPRNDKAEAITNLSGVCARNPCYLT